jgi:hypothetical protein
MTTKIVKVTIESVKSTFPYDTVGGKWNIFLDSINGEDSYEYFGTANFHTFEEVNDDSNYIIFASRLDDNGELLGEVISEELDWPEDIAIFTAGNLTIDVL